MSCVLLEASHIVVTFLGLPWLNDFEKQQHIKWNINSGGFVRDSLK